MTCLYLFKEEFMKKLSANRFFFVFLQKISSMFYEQLSDEDILMGFRQGDEYIIRTYFYGYCQIGYNIFDQRYQLRGKQNLDFMSLAHQYALYLMEHEKFDYMQQKRTTPERITSLQPNEIFVFGSNLRGMHGGGAAYIAYRKFGAIMGQGVGLQGQSYGIPTMQGGVETIRPYVDDFIEFAKQHPELTFLVTRIGCGIAGFTDEEISPLFEKAHDEENIVLPEGW